MSFNKLIKKYKKKKIKIGIVGIGYVGLKLLLQFAKNKVQVLGFDNNLEKLNMLNKRISPISYIKNSEIKKTSNYSSYNNDYSKLKECDAIILCLPTPLKNKKPDLSHIINTLKKIKKYFKKNQLLVLESTTYPGTTEEKIKPFLDKKFLIGKNFFLGYSPERENPGDNSFAFKNIPKICSGYSTKCTKLCLILYQMIVDKTVAAKNIKEAEFSKLIENIYRSVNISMVNEMKMISHKLNIDINNVLNLANTKPFGFTKFEPGPGIGGHCIPIDPYYLYWKAKQVNIDAKFIKLAGQTNEDTTNWVINNFFKILTKEKKIAKKTKLLILGLAYKKNIEDTRESASKKIIINLHGKLKKIDVSEPYIKMQNSVVSEDSIFLNKYKINNILITKNIIQKYDVVMILSDHDCFDYNLIKKESKILIDTRNRIERKNRFYKL
jgi:UDP-N-acetyl-D-glucosamine dehydrogenase